jgi:hypothetical protein
MKRGWPLAVDPNPHSHGSNVRVGSVDEDAYRRGFEHGMTAVLHLPWVTVSRPKRAQRWIRAVWKWRCMTSHKYRIPPPVPKLTDDEKVEAKRWWRHRGRPWLY